LLDYRYLIEIVRLLSAHLPRALNMFTFDFHKISNLLAFQL
jgi:hypothetical protein